jgi:hypothetical protein
MFRFLLLIIGMTSLGYGAAVQSPNRWTQLMALINQEMRILENAKRKGPELEYRLLELHSEKLKLIHEKNNNEFLTKSLKSNIAQKKESYFTETRSYYAQTKKFGLAILSRYPGNRRQAEIFFALALNSRDYGKDLITESYLLKTISLVKDPHHSLRHHAETALADFYYNEKRYMEAISYYQRAIQKTEDEWLTKHLFNLSWCYLKVREFDKAIDTIRESYGKSKNPAYINIKDQVLDNVGSFYVYAGRPIEGLEFYLKNEKDPIPYLIPMSLKTSDKGHEKETEAILASVQKLIDQHDWFHYQEELYHTYLDFYRHYNRFTDHEQTSRKLVAYYKKAESDKELKLKIELKDDAIEKMRSLAGYLQLKLAKDMKKDESKYHEKDLQLVLNFFKHLISLDDSRKAEYLYFRGETFYSVRRLEDAAPAYVDSVVESKQRDDKAQARKALDSLMALTGQELLEKELNTKYLIFAYSEHINIWPRDERSEQIYPKLFAIYMSKNVDTQATEVLRSFNQAYPEHLKDQQLLMTKVLDLFIEKKDTKKLAHWIHEFKKGFLAFKLETIEKTEIVLGNILFLQYQDMAKKGDKYAAAKGFESIYVNKLYTDKIKSQSAFFAALTYLEMGETETSFYWQTLALGRMTNEEKLERREEQLKIAERTYKLQDFKTSFKLSSLLLNNFCSLKDKIQERFYEISVMTALVEEDAKGAEEIVDKFSRCLSKIELKQIARAQIYQLLEKKGEFHALRNFVKKNHYEPFLTQYRFTLQKWFWERSSAQLKSLIHKEFAELKHPETNAWLTEMKLYKAAISESLQLAEAQIWNAPEFDGDKFNKSLEAHLLKVQQFKQRYHTLTQSTQTDLAILSTKLFSEIYLSLGEKILALAPQGMDQQTMTDFKKAMKQVGSQFTLVSRQFNKQLDSALKEKETLAWGARAIASVEEVENPVFSFYTGLTMDKDQEY